MRVIPVLDIRQGRAVHAVAGDRAYYGPLRSVLHGGPDPIALARAGRDVWGLGDLYLADLDAILGESPPDLSLLRALRGLGLDLWVDAGVRDADDLPGLLGAGVDRVVVGLETVSGPEALAGIVDRAGADRVVFSLDLVEGRPMVDTVPRWGTDDDPSELALRAIAGGVRRIIRLDLARVGTGRRRLTRRAEPGRIAVELAGGPWQITGSSGSSAGESPGPTRSGNWDGPDSVASSSARPCTTGGSARETCGLL